ncbi:PREDICTED: zinc finger protein 8-like [Nelumbo nucifera]|uniref:Zinc finger protein 8-like n=1 Tax=Nelumbo nucifera TaxID=4432 RepID=A0A1U7Z750_NELNU|nr:PREDICTED: zinc finger protein 8-like [Nelumbo nucifera]
MEKAERETHDFMNVDSFSQLPFIRPAPVKEKGIRLFGIEFGGDVATADESESVETNVTEDAKDNDNGESGRKFECHYCCRNFPTSQALGGHQNAHKRERQHAKRAHLQTAMAQSGIPDGHVYGLVNYRQLGSTATPTLTYRSWTNTNVIPTNNRFYGSHHSSFPQQQPPINGSPLALWRIPPAQSSPNFSNLDRSSLLPLFSEDDDSRPAPIGGGSTATHQGRHMYEAKKSNVQDHVSLDLHL